MLSSLLDGDMADGSKTGEKGGQKGANHRKEKWGTILVGVFDVGTQEGKFVFDYRTSWRTSSATLAGSSRIQYETSSA